MSRMNGKKTHTLLLLLLLGIKGHGVLPYTVELSGSKQIKNKLKHDVFQAGKTIQHVLLRNGSLQRKPGPDYGEERIAQSKRVRAGSLPIVDY